MHYITTHTYTFDHFSSFSPWILSYKSTFQPEPVDIEQGLMSFWIHKFTRINLLYWRMSKSELGRFYGQKDQAKWSEEVVLGGLCNKGSIIRIGTTTMCSSNVGLGLLYQVGHMARYTYNQSHAMIFVFVWKCWKETRLQLETSIFPTKKFPPVF